MAGYATDMLAERDRKIAELQDQVREWEKATYEWQRSSQEKQDRMAELEVECNQNNELVAELTDIVLRLRAGEADTPIPDGVVLESGAEWLRKYNDASADTRLRMAEAVLSATRTAHECFIKNHDAELAQLQDQVRELTVQRDEAGIRARNFEAELNRQVGINKELAAQLQSWCKLANERYDQITNWIRSLLEEHDRLVAANAEIARLRTAPTSEGHI